MPSETGPTVWRAVAAASLAVVLVAAPLMLLVHVPAYTRVLVSAVGGPELSALPAPVALQAAEDVRQVVAGGDEAALPATVGGREGFGAAERAHLADVRDVVAAARTAALVALAVAAIALWRLRRAGGRREAARAGTWTGILVLVLFASAALAGLIDFDWLFARFHGVFFDAGTWTFPYSSLLVQLFPLPFWAISGAVWATACLTAATGIVVIGRRHEREEV